MNKNDIKRLKKENEDLKDKLKKTREDFEAAKRHMEEEASRFRSTLNDALSHNMELVKALNNLKKVTEQFVKLGLIND